MKFLFKVFVIILLLSSCQKTKEEIEKIKAEKAYEICCKDETVQLLDVRTQEEYENGHLVNAINIDINSSFFKDRALNQLSKDRVVIVYCLSGIRSHEAGVFLKKNGYKVVYDLDGGMLSWTSHNLKTINPKLSNEGMNLIQYNELLDKYSTNKNLLLVSFNAKWCANCKEVDKILTTLQKKYNSKISIVKIDIDNHQSLAKQLDVKGVPYLILYQNHQVVWDQVGLPQIEKLDSLINKRLEK